MPESLSNVAVEGDACISEDEVLAFLTGALEGEHLLRVTQHIEGCEACRQVVFVAGAHARSIAKADSGAREVFGGKTNSDVLLRSLRTVDALDYVVEGELARGGMGRILLATDRQGRRVAIKVLLGTGERATRRFLREMQVTARLQHPSIITLYEAGRWATGEPFFAMKLVQGRPLREELAQLTTLKERLALVPRLIAVTDALAYAHDQGVIHRDLKPGNILVGAFGETVVIDWGLAKMPGLSSGDDSESSGEVPIEPHHHDTTDQGTPIGTPAYMAPEQARGEVLDERADVYGLGALLYHVLSGRAPYSGLSVRDLLAQVRDGPPPSLRERMPDLPTDLVAIVERAMMTDAARRYPTAKSMAEDLRRFSAGQLVSVHSYSTRALVRRWARKNRAALSVAAVLLALGAVAAWASIDRIIRERGRAEGERAIAIANRSAAESLVNFLLTEFRDRVSSADRLDLVDGLGAYVSRYFEDSDQSGAVLDVTALTNRAVALRALGGVECERRNLPQARALYDHALDYFRRADRGDATPAAQRVLEGQAWQGYGSLEHLEGNTDAALAAHRRAIALADRSVAAAPDNLDADLLAASNWARICETLHMRKGDLRGSLAACTAGIDRLEPWLAKRGSEPRLLRQLASLHQLTSDRYLVSGDLDEASSQISTSGELYARLLSVAPDDRRVVREYAYTFVFLGVVEVARGRLDAALTAIAENVQRYQGILRNDHGNLASEEDLGVGYAFQCDFERRALRLDAARAACLEAMSIFRRHRALDGANANTLSLLVLSLTNLGRVEVARRDSGLARAALNEALEIARGLVESDPASGKWKEDLAMVLTWLVDYELRFGQLAPASPHLTEALALADSLFRASPQNTDLGNGLARLRTFAGDAALQQNQPELAATSYAAARQVLEPLLAQSPGMVDFQTGFARASAGLARAREAAKNAPAEEIQRLHQVLLNTLETLRRAGKLYPEDAAQLSASARVALKTEPGTRP